MHTCWLCFLLVWWSTVERPNMCRPPACSHGLQGERTPCHSSMGQCTEVTGAAIFWTLPESECSCVMALRCCSIYQACWSHQENLPRKCSLGFCCSREDSSTHKCQCHHCSATTAQWHATQTCRARSLECVTAIPHSDQHVLSME